MKPNHTLPRTGLRPVADFYRSTTLANVTMRLERISKTDLARGARTARLALLLVSVTVMAAGCATSDWADFRHSYTPGAPDPDVYVDERTGQPLETVPNADRGKVWPQKY